MTPSLIDQARSLLAEITPGEWFISEHDGAIYANRPDVGSLNEPEEVAEVYGARNDAFIAAAPQLVRALLDALLTAAQEQEHLKAQRNTLHNELSYRDLQASGGLPEAQGAADKTKDWAADNCYTLARRELKRLSGLERDDNRALVALEAWRHIIRICERGGCAPAGVLREEAPPPCGHYRVFAMPQVHEDGSESPYCMQCDRDTLQAEVTRLRAVISTYGQHTRECETQMRRIAPGHYERNFGPDACTCGFSAFTGETT
jgi:hypothetical protein